MKPDSELQIQFSDFFTAQKVSIPVKFLLGKIAYLTGLFEPNIEISMNAILQNFTHCVNQVFFSPHL